MSLVKKHATTIAQAVAKDGVGAIQKKYSEIVAHHDMTLGECVVLRNELNKAIADMLQKHERTIAAVMHHCQQHDPVTGYYKNVTPYEILEIIHEKRLGAAC